MMAKNQKAVKAQLCRDELEVTLRVASECAVHRSSRLIGALRDNGSRLIEILEFLFSLYLRFVFTSLRDPGSSIFNEKHRYDHVGQLGDNVW